MPAIKEQVPDGLWVSQDENSSWIIQKELIVNGVVVLVALYENEKSIKPKEFRSRADAVIAGKRASDEQWLLSLKRQQHG
jgi:hypothetical protein